MSKNNFAQINLEHFQIFDKNGNTSNIEEILKQIENNQVVFLGESHDDSVAHKLQFEIFKRTFEQFGHKRKVSLSLEMFERDVQIVLDEYLQGLITEKYFLESSRPWGNYQTDYRSLVEFARVNKLKVIAANAPRRYINRVSRLGKNSLKSLSAEAKTNLAPLPFANSSKAYTEKFNKLMEGHGSENILDSQTLWDATMAYSISEELKSQKNALVVHLNGSFHTASRLGTVEQLFRYKKDVKALVVTMVIEENFQQFDMAKHKNLGDFIILTDAKQPRSKK
jgi:uncharacterized iron-regulated protein